MGVVSYIRRQARAQDRKNLAQKQIVHPVLLKGRITNALSYTFSMRYTYMAYGIWSVGGGKALRTENPREARKRSYLYIPFLFKADTEHTPVHLYT